MKKISAFIVTVLLMTTSVCFASCGSCDTSVPADPAAAVSEAAPAAVETASEAVVPAASEAAAVVPAPARVSGMLVDLVSARAQAPEALAAFAENYTKAEALAPTALEGGYGIVADGKLVAFAAESTAIVAEFLKKDDSALTVTVDGVMNGDVLTVGTINNQQ